MGGAPPTTHASPKRIWRFLRSVRHVLAWERVSGLLLEVIVGHLVSMTLVCRELLSVVSACYGFIQESGIDVQRASTQALTGGVKGYFDTAKPNRVHTSAGESELNNSRTGQQVKLYKGKTDAETMAGGVQSMIAQREAYYNGPERRKLLAGRAP